MMIERRLRSLLEQFPGKSVLILGDVMLDEYIWGEVTRISPEAPVPVVEMQTRSYLPGGAANTAANIAGLGGQAWLAGVVGEDHQAEQFRGAVGACGVRTDGILTDPARPTTSKTRIIAGSQQVVRLDIENKDALAPAMEEQLLTWCAEKIAQMDACILSDYDKGVITPSLSQAFIAMARQAGKPVVVDPKGIDYSKYRGATVIKPNLHEAQEAIHHRIKTEADLLKVGQRLLSILADCAILLTRGAKGMSLFLDPERVIHIPTMARHVFDVTGAGDTVVSVMAMALASGMETEEAARLANYAAGIVVGKIGTAAVTLEELLQSEPRD
ncbi:MAG: D-glycero-beta-D-manno-heptose-7-phosphate kinase [bacterium]|jgi:D-beta-D-heptose 7-phosphate kinase/D-beta-D-heptose 1-phosphate adenosyltransferase|nr:D-glycero-beta-D-manno-heptose-7-phosphate kinase [bacterium]